MSVTFFPVGDQLLGCVLNSAGDPLDQKGDFASAQHVPLYQSHSSMLTSIKLYDTLSSTLN